MGLTFVTRRELEEGMGSLWTSDGRYWLTADRSRAVPDGDPDAAYLLAAHGQQISMAVAFRHGLVKKADEAAKAAPKPADKAVRPKANKGE